MTPSFGVLRRRPRWRSEWDEEARSSSPWRGHSSLCLRSALLVEDSATARTHFRLLLLTYTFLSPPSSHLSLPRLARHSKWTPLAPRARSCCSPAGMAPPPTHSPTTGKPVPPHYIHASSSHFRTTDGRTILLRGINVASSAKTPVGQSGAQLQGFWEGAKSGDITFVGRVLELDKADEHLERLRSWGFNSLRYVFTWESLEHEGP